MKTKLYTGEINMSSALTKEQEFGWFIKELRESRGLTMRDVSNACDFSPAHLSNLERGQNASGRKVKASPEVIKELSYVYQFPYPVLMEKAGYAEGYYSYTGIFINNNEDLAKKEDLRKHETVGDRINKLMINKGFTISDLAHLIKIYEPRGGSFGIYEFNEETIEKVIKDEIEPPSKFIVASSHFFNVSCDWLLTGKEFTLLPNDMEEKRLADTRKYNDVLELAKKLYELKPLIEALEVVEDED
jgi:transcriptional regulator with XRE-family HTH domain